MKCLNCSREATWQIASDNHLYVAGAILSGLDKKGYCIECIDIPIRIMQMLFKLSGGIECRECEKLIKTINSSNNK